MPNLRKPTDKETPVPGTRGVRLRQFVFDSAAYEDIAMIYWSPEDGGRWVLWRDPDPLEEKGIGIENT